MLIMLQEATFKMVYRISVLRLCWQSSIRQGNDPYLGIGLPLNSWGETFSAFFRKFFEDFNSN